jgi:hypothetical protein
VSAVAFIRFYSLSNTSEEAMSRDEKSLRVKEFCEAEGIGPTTFYKQVKLGLLEAKKVGSATIVTPEARRKWRESLPTLRTMSAA